MTTAERALPTRAEVPGELRWNVESVYSTEAEWERDFALAEERLPELGRYQCRLAESGATLLEALRLRGELMRLVTRLATYARMRRAEDATNPVYAALADRGVGLTSRARAATAYFEPELLATPRATLDRFVAETPGLEVYRHYFDRIERSRQHIRSPEVEEVLALAGNLAASPANTHNALENADMRLPPIVDEAGNELRLAPGNAGRYVRSRDRRVRRDAWNAVADGFLSLRHGYAATLAGAVQRDVFFARARRYASSLEAALDPNAIPTAVFFNLLETVWRNFPIWQRYFRLRARILGVDRIWPYDMSAPLAGQPRPVPFDEAVDLIAEGLRPLGEEYVRILRRGVADGWVDRASNVGKGSGAFSTGSPGTHPFIMMNYGDDTLSLGTLAHELGHSMHSYYTWQHQPMLYARYSMFVAETASNMHQALVGRHLLRTIDDRNFKIAVIEERMANHLRYLFTMPILARFELECHERVERGAALTADGMSELLIDLYRQGYGDAVEFDPPRVGIIWAEFSHLFANFYVFQYATGISAAAALAERVLDEGEPAARRYVEFLKAGDSRFPIDALKLAGVDMTGPEPVQRAFDHLDALISQLDELTREG